MTLSDNRLLDLQAPLYGIHSPTGASGPLTNPVVCLVAEQQRKLKNGPLRGRHVGLTVGHFFSKSFQTSIWITLHTEEQTHHLNSAVIYCLWRDNACVHLQCTCANQEQMDSHSVASKVNREVCQLEVNGCLLTRLCALISLSGRKGKWQRRSHYLAVLFSCLLFRGQHRSGFDKAAFISIYKAGCIDKGRMKPVLFISRSVRDCSQHVFVGGD